MTRITYIENALPVTIEVTHATDLTLIGHASIYCRECSKVGMNTFDYSMWKHAHKELSVLKSIISNSSLCDEMYFDLMVSGDISRILE